MQTLHDNITSQLHSQARIFFEYYLFTNGDHNKLQMYLKFSS